MHVSFHGIAQQQAQKIKTTLRLITPALAHEILTTMAYPYQRPIDSAHVTRLAFDMTEQRFAPGSSIRIAHLTTPQASYLIDGQHRLSAVVKAQQPILFTQIDETMESEEYLAWVYGKTDTGKKRNAADLYRPLKLEDETALSSTQIRYLAGACELMVNNGMARPGVSNRMNPAERIALLRLYAPVMHQFTDMARHAMPKVKLAIRRSYVVAVAMVTLRYQPYGTTKNGITPNAVDFWQQAFKPNKILDTDPRFFAYTHLTGTQMTTATGITNSTSLVNPEYGARYLIAAFNKYMRHEEIKQKIKILDSKAPVKIEGIDPALDWTA
jgi:hypothetical protein